MSRSLRCKTLSVKGDDALHDSEFSFVNSKNVSQRIKHREFEKASKQRKSVLEFKGLLGLVCQWQRSHTVLSHRELCYNSGAEVLTSPFS